jgi:hypothetical protein
VEKKAFPMRITTKLLLCLFVLFFACGKKGPLKPPVIELPGIKDASFNIVEDRVLIRAVMDKDIEFFKIERIELDNQNKPFSSKVVYEGIEKNLYFIDKNLDTHKTYQYKIVPFLKKNKVGNIYLSTPISFKLVRPPYNLKAEILETLGSITLYYEGDNCDSYRVYRYKKGEKKTKIPLIETKDTYFNDDSPIMGSEIFYEVSCLKDGKESINNPSILINLK